MAASPVVKRRMVCQVLLWEFEKLLIEKTNAYYLINAMSRRLAEQLSGNGFFVT